MKKNEKVYNRVLFFSKRCFFSFFFFSGQAKRCVLHLLFFFLGISAALAGSRRNRWLSLIRIDSGQIGAYRTEKKKRRATDMQAVVSPARPCVRHRCGGPNVASMLPRFLCKVYDSKKLNFISLYD